MMSEPIEALFMTATSPMEAQIIRSVLESAGIPVRIAGEFLQDDWASVMSASNLNAVELFVPTPLVQEARRAVEAAQEREGLESEESESED